MHPKKCFQVLFEILDKSSATLVNHGRNTDLCVHTSTILIAHDIRKARHRLDSDGVKLFATTAAKEIADASMQVMGGYGYVGEYHVELIVERFQTLEIGGGTLESHQKNITASCQDAVINHSMISTAECLQGSGRLHAVASRLFQQ